jgi:prevent-host-death family protein
MVTVNIHELKAHLSSFVDRVEQGEVIVLCRHNKPVAELRPIFKEIKQKTRVPGLLKGKFQWELDAFAPMTPQEVAEFDRDQVLPKNSG